MSSMTRLYRSSKHEMLSQGRSIAYDVDPILKQWWVVVSWLFSRFEVNWNPKASGLIDGHLYPITWITLCIFYLFWIISRCLIVGLYQPSQHIFSSDLYFTLFNSRPISATAAYIFLRPLCRIGLHLLSLLRHIDNSYVSCRKYSLNDFEKHCVFHSQNIVSFSSEYCVMI